MLNVKHIWATFCLLLMITEVSAQDMIRIGVGGDFRAEKFIQTFSLDLNRTEKVDEKEGKFAFWSGTFYALPSIDVNLGPKPSSSENNVTSAVKLGLRKLSKAGTTTSAMAFEFNPTYSADKEFIERMAYMQFRGILQRTVTVQKMDNGNPFFKYARSYAGGVYSNMGQRKSTAFNDRELYLTAGVFGEFRSVIRRFTRDRQADGSYKKSTSDTEDDWSIKVSGKYYRVFSDIEGLYEKDFAGALSASIDKIIYKKTAIGLVYKFGNDNPTYKTVNTIELALKVNL